MTEKYKFTPDYAVAPGATLKETIELKGLSQADLASRTGLTEKTISQIVSGIAPITYETAEKLEFALGIPARFWNKRELSYREALLKIEERKRLESDVEWLATIPMKVLIKRKYVEDSPVKTDVVRSVLKFFAVSGVDTWSAVWGSPVAVKYRGAEVQEKHPGYVAAWLRMGEIEAEKIECEPFDPKAFRQALIDIRELTVEKAAVWLPAVIKLCAAAGVAVVFVREIPGASVSGATKWLTKDKALIQLSLKYKTDDQLWFTFFHEAGHILLHGKREVFLENGHSSDRDEEHEANAFARDILIHPSLRHHFPHLKSLVAIRQFAVAQKIAPGIVVGRLQREGILPHSHCNGLKRKLAWPAEPEDAE